MFFILIFSSVFFQHLYSQEPNTVLGIVSDPNATIAYPDAITITPDGLYAYVANEKPTLSIVDLNPLNPTYNSVIGVVSGLNSPSALAATFDNKYLYVANYYDGVSIVDRATNTVTGAVEDTGFPFLGPYSVAITPNNLYAYVANYGINFTAGTTVNIVDLDPLSTNYNKVIGIVSDPSDTFNGPSAIAITPDGLHAYVANYGFPDGGTTVSIVDLDPLSTDYNKVIGIVSDAGNTIQTPNAITITPDGTRAYVANNNGNTVSIIDLDPLSDNYNRVIGTVLDPLSTINAPTDVAITPDNLYAYVANNNGNTVSIVSLENNTVIGTAIDPNFTLNGPYWLDVTPNGSYVYVANISGSSVSIIGSDIVNNFSGCKRKNLFLNQVDNYNHLTWSAPNNFIAVSYQIYRDAALTQLVATVPASGILQYDDHNRNPNVNYGYYIVGVNALGAQSGFAATTVTQSC